MSDEQSISEQYARRAAAAPRLRAGEAAELVALARAGHPWARASVMESHRRIVATITKQYAGTELSSTSRIELGEQGLAMAIDRFDSAKGFTFSTYATWYIRQEMTRGMGGGEGTAKDGASPRPRPPSGAHPATLQEMRIAGPPQ